MFLVHQEYLRTVAENHDIMGAPPWSPPQIDGQQHRNPLIQEFAKLCQVAPAGMRCHPPPCRKVLEVKQQGSPERGVVDRFIDFAGRDGDTVISQKAGQRNRCTVITPGLLGEGRHSRNDDRLG